MCSKNLLEVACHVPQSVIRIFDSFNTFLQFGQRMIHVLYHSSLRLYCLLFSRFILPVVISESDDMLSIDLEDPDVLKDSKSFLILCLNSLLLLLDFLENKW